MPSLTNTFLVRVMRLVRELFQAERFEYGIVNLTSADNDRVITIDVGDDVRRVWTSIQEHVHPYNEQHANDMCFVSEATPVPNGFQITVKVHGACRLGWFAIM